MRQFVYFIQAQETKKIKIGHSQSPHMRLDQLQTGHHEELKIMYKLPCDEAPTIEERLRTAFAKDKIRGEWFEPSPVLLAFIKALSDAAAVLPSSERNPTNDRSTDKSSSAAEKPPAPVRKEPLATPALASRHAVLPHAVEQSSAGSAKQFGSLGNVAPAPLQGVNDCVALEFGSHGAEPTSSDVLGQPRPAGPVTRVMLLNVIRATKGNVAAAARALGISEKYTHDLFHKYPEIREEAKTLRIATTGKSVGRPPYEHAASDRRVQRTKIRATFNP